MASFRAQRNSHIRVYSYMHVLPRLNLRKRLNLTQAAIISYNLFEQAPQIL